MAEVERFDTWRQRAALVGLIDEPDFLASPEGFAFIEQLKVHIAPKMVGFLRYKQWKQDTGFWLEEDDVVNSAVDILTANEGRVARYASLADEPWGYLWRALLGRLAKERDWLGAPLETVTFYRSPYEADEDSHFTPLDEVVARTLELLAPLTDAKLHGELFRLLGWLAANPPQRLSYEAVDARAAHRHCPAFTIGQVTAVMNIAYGGRPRNAATSIMGAFLLDPNFTISEGSTQAVALETYKRRMIAERNGSRSLADWN